MSDVFIGLGSNIGDRLANIDQAVALLAKSVDVTIRALSSVYETKPVGYLEQGDFLNAVVWVRTALAPRELLALTKGIEAMLRRSPGIRYGPRIIDLDILIFDNVSIDEPHLRLPHPEITNRAFVLVPMVELAGDKRHHSGKTYAELLAGLPEEEVAGVRLYRETRGPASRARKDRG